MSHRRLRLLLLGVFFLAGTVRAEQWSRFRGPNGTGIGDAEIPAKWSATDYNWTTELPGGGHSSPVVWDDRIFVTCANDKTGAEMVVCVNAADGSIRWNHPYASHSFAHHPDNSYASSTAAVDEKHVYVCWSTPEELTIAALDHDGKEVWKRGLGPFISQHGGGQSPIVFENLVILSDEQEGPENALFAFNRDTGDVVWKTARRHSDKFSPATPCVFHPKNGPAQLIFASKSHGLCAIDPHDGHEIWELPQVFDARTVSSPVTAEGLIWGTCGEGGGGHVLVAARPGADGKSAAVAYDIRRGTPYVPTPIIVGKLLFYWADNGTITCARADTGESVWKHRVDANFYSSPVCAGGKIFCMSKDGEVFVIDAGETFKQLGQNVLGLEDGPHPPCATTPAIAGGRMYLRTYTHLVSVGGKK